MQHRNLMIHILAVSFHPQPTSSLMALHLDGLVATWSLEPRFTNEYCPPHTRLPQFELV